jgi:hypothetical protein
LIDFCPSLEENLEVKAGELAKRFDEPIDLRGGCSDRFADFLRAGQQTAHDDLGAIPGATELILLLESDVWSDEVGVPAPEAKPLFTERHCKCERQNGSASVERSTSPVLINS